jgi:arylsulfatase
MVEPWVGSAGPWRGTYFTGLEGSLRVPFIMRWPGKVPAGRVSNEIVHEMDLFTTFATISGGKVPTDRAIDGVDQTAFFTGKQEQSNRDSVVIYVGKELFGVKWRDWKMMSKEMDTGTSPIKQYSIPHIYNLLLDPREERPMTNALENFWVVHPLANVLLEHMTSLKKYPPIAPGTPDPYSPPTAQ